MENYQRQKQFFDRNILIRKAHKRGESQASIAIRHKISRERVRQIVSKGKP